jgi:hypothetical protein
MSRAWLTGENPYDAAGVLYAWVDGGGPPDQWPLLGRTHVLLYPPTTLAAVSPLAVLRFGASEAVWVLLNAGLYAATLWAVARLGRLRGNWLLVFLALGVWLAPVGTGMKVGQTGAVTVALVALGALAVQRGTGGEWWAGAMMGLGTAIKPQLGLPFVVYEAGRVRWRLLLAAAVMIGGLAAVGVARLEKSQPGWRAAWAENIRLFPLQEDGNPRRENAATRHHMLNLQYPLHSFTDDRRLVTGLAVGIVAAPCLVYLVIDLRDQRRRGRLLKPGAVEDGGELLSLSMAAVASLLVVYHRAYDGVAVVFPMGLAAAGLMRGERRHWVTLGLCLPFLAPGAVMLVDASNRGWVPAALVGSLVWEGLIVPHEVWALYLLMWWCVRLRWRSAQDAARVMHPPS